MLEVGKPFLAFSLPGQDDKPHDLKDYTGKWLVVYFYPKDNSSGCFMEAQSFALLFNDFAKNQAGIVGVSPDSIKSHCNFTAKYNLPFTLLSDPEHILLSAAGVWRQKKMYGREYMGVARTTALLDPQGIVRALWPKVKVKGHAQEVYDKFKELK